MDTDINCYKNVKGEKKLSSVTQRINNIKQPKGGYLNPKEFKIIHIEDIEPLTTKVARFLGK